MGSQALYSLSNALATPEQIAQPASALDGLPPHIIHSVRYQGSLLTQSAGILLRLGQDVTAQAIVTFTRFYAGPEGGSFRAHSAKDISAGSIYLTAKLSANPLSPRSVLNVYAYLLSSRSPLPFLASLSQAQLKASMRPSDVTAYTLSPGDYQSALLNLQRAESLILRTLSFNTRIVVPHGLALTYLSTLGALPPGKSNETSRALAARTIELLNAALLSPQQLYLTHQPHALAVAACYLAARETGVRLVGEEGGAWWEVFDVDREELGFLVVGMLSVAGWVSKELEGNRTGLLSVEEVEMEVERRDAQA